MKRKENLNISREVFKFPYNGNFETNDDEMFSEKFCCYTIKIRKKVRKNIVTGATQNAGSEKKQPSNGSWDYDETMRELDCQSSKKRVEIQVGDQMYMIKNPNPYSESVDVLADKLAEQI